MGTIDKPAPVPQKKITSVDITTFASGLFLNGEQTAPLNSVTACKDIELDVNGFIIPRRVLQPFLPDTIETTYQKFPAIWNGEMYYFTLDDGHAKFCQKGDVDWTDCGPIPVAAALTTALTGANNDLAFTADVAGPDGNDITIAYINAGASKPLVVSVVGSAISVQLATNGSSVITSTASLVLAALNASTPAAALINTALAPTNTGAGLVTALSATPLTGGTGTNFLTTQNGGRPKFVRVLNNVLILNGKNGDKLAYIDLTTPGFPVVKYSLVDDPTDPLTDTLNNLSSGDFNLYYAYSYTGAVGQTELSPILTIPLNVVRDQWQTQTTPASIKITRPDFGSEPAGAKYWTLFVALAPTSGTIQPSDMLELAVKLGIDTADFVDDGSLSINLGSVAPTANSTDGPRVNNGIVEDGNPILFQDEDAQENIWIGGGGQYAMDFSISNGGYLAQPEQGTNYQVTGIIGFRNGQGTPSLTVLFSNTEGLAKQSVLEQQTVNYGDQSFNVWGVTEQHYGAAGVAAAESMINYNGKLLFWSTDGIMSMDTQAAKQNVLSTVSISIQAIDSYIRKVKNSAMPKIVGTGWNNKFHFTVPNDGFDDPQQILISDDNNKGAFYPLDIPADWIGVISPTDEAAFVYVSQGKRTLKLVTGSGTFDTIDGVSVPFSTRAVGPLAPMGGQAHNEWQANVQVMFYFLGLVGDVTVGVKYRNQNGKYKTKTKVYHGPVFTPSAAGGWGDPGWSYAGFPQVPGWGRSPIVNDALGIVTAEDARIPIQVDDIMNEAQWFYITNTGFSTYKLRAISAEGIDLGVRPDLQ